MVSQMDQFGRAEKVINVIDVRQSYLQQVVYDCLRKLGFKKEAKNSKHLDYEVVVLGVLHLFLKAELPEAVVDDLLRVALADVDHVDDLLGAAESVHLDAIGSGGQSPRR